MAQEKHPSSKKSAQRIKIGVVTGAHGVHGRVKIRSFTEDSSDIGKYGEVQDAEGVAVPLRVTSIPAKDGMVIAEIGGVKDRNEAEALAGLELFVDRKSLPATKEHVYYHADLLSLSIKQYDTGEVVGQVVAVHNFGAGDILEIEFSANHEKEMYIFDCKTFPEVNVAEGYALFNPPTFLVAKE